MRSRMMAGLGRRITVTVQCVLGLAVLWQTSALATCGGSLPCGTWSTPCPAGCNLSGGFPDYQECCCINGNNQCCSFTCAFWACLNSTGACSQNSVDRSNPGGPNNTPCAANKCQ